MPKQTTKSALSAKLGARGRSGFEEHKADPTTLGGGGSDLPAGIEGGIAQLVDCKFGTYEKGDNQGEPFFFAAGVVKSPTLHNGIGIEGLRTQYGPEPLCDTKTKAGKETTLEDHLARVLNEMRKLGVSTDELDFDNLETVAAALKEQKPHFRFRTWQGDATPQYPNPRVNHDWRGACEYNGEANGEIVDESGSEVPDTTVSTTGEMAVFVDEDELTQLVLDAENGDAEATQRLEGMCKLFGIDNESIGTWAEVADAIRAESSKDTAAPFDTGDVDYVALGALADGGDEDALATLDAAGREAGHDPDDTELFPTWASLAVTLAGIAEATTAPEVGSVWKFRPMDWKTKKHSSKATDFEVISVDVSAGTCTLKDLATARLYSDPKTKKAAPVRWEQLS